MARGLLWLLIMLLSACATAPALPPLSNPPQQMPIPTMLKAQRPVVAFVLGSGAARGYAHVGVLNVLEANGIKADIVVGCSAGSVVGALYAAGIRGDALLAAAEQLDINQLADWGIPNRGMFKGERLQRYVNQLLDNRPIEALPTPFVAVATDLESGELVAFNHGNTGAAVRASSSIPGLVQPYVIGRREFVDGGLVSQVPVRVARAMGADIIIAVDVSKTMSPLNQLDSTMAVMRQAIVIMTYRLAETEMAEADILIRPRVGGIKINEYELRLAAVAAGEAAASAEIPYIKQMINARSYRADQPPDVRHSLP